MQKPRSYDLGPIKVMAEDLETWNPYSNKRMQAWNDPWEWGYEEGGRSLKWDGWRLPNMDELWYLGSLMELGVLGLNTIPDSGDEDQSHDPGYWSSLEMEKNGEDYAVMIVKKSTLGKKEIWGDDVAHSGGRRHYRIRLVKENK